MNRNIFTTRHKIRRAVFDLIGASLIIGVSVILLMAYFDVLTK